MRKRLRAMLSRGGDSFLAIILVVAFFLAFIVILVASFPQGSGLSTVFEAGTPLERTAPTDPAKTESWDAALARLAAVKRTVKNRPAGSIVWNSASQGMELREQDAVQTFREAGATIVFQPGQEIVLGENSLVLIRRFEKEATTGTHRASVLLLGGSIEGELASTGGAPTSVEILAGKAGTMIASSRGGPAGFRIAAGTDDSAVISVSKGDARVQVGSHAVIVNAGQVVNIGPGGTIDGPTSLPRPPELLKPEKGTVFPTRVPPTGIVFEWKDDHSDRSFRLEIARDGSFKDRVIDELVKDPSFTHPGFPVGRYYWRVRCVRGPAEGRVTQPRDFEVARDVDPPLLRVEYPEGPLSHGEVVIRGATDPGAKVYIGNTLASVDPDGAFEAHVTLSRGVQVLVVEAVDSVGNIAYDSRTLTAR